MTDLIQYSKGKITLIALMDTFLSPPLLSRIP